VNLAGSSIDKLGRKGVEGRVDEKYKERISNAVLTSAFDIALAGALEKFIPQPVTSSSTTSNNAVIDSINKTATTIFTDNVAYPNAQTKIVAICGQIIQIIPPTSTTLVSSATALCTAAQAPPAGGNYTPQLQNLITGLNSMTGAAVQSAAVAATPSMEQKASEEAFKSLSGTVKEMITQNDFKTTITVNQGETIRIYVNRDYTFPNKVRRTTRILQ
jgi:type IV secretion system protein VirB10